MPIYRMISREKASGRKRDTGNSETPLCIASSRFLPSERLRRDARVAQPRGDRPERRKSAREQREERHGGEIKKQRRKTGERESAPGETEQGVRGAEG